VWTSKGGGSDGYWADLPASAVDAITSQAGDSDSYVLLSPVTAYVSGDTDWINQFFKYVTGTMALAGVLVHCNSGTATLDVYQGNPNATTLLSAEGLNSLSVSTTPTLYVPSSPINVLNLDAFRIQITATSGGPLTATFFWDKS
jgi:hypothetical protein